LHDRAHWAAKAGAGQVKPRMQFGFGAKAQLNAREESFPEFWLLPSGEPVLQVDVPELVNRACLPQYSAPVGIGEEAHQRSRQPVAERQPPHGEQV